MDRDRAEPARASEGFRLRCALGRLSCMTVSGGSVRSKRTASWVETTIEGRATATEIRAMVADYSRLGGGSTWVIDAASTTSYSADAIQAAVDLFAALAKQRGLTRIVALIERPTVRMGASVVSMSLRTIGSPLAIDVVEDRAALARALG